MERLLAQHGIEARPVENRVNSFSHFLASRTSMLTDSQARDRLARSVVFADMPDIWQDARASLAFETSFFEDLGYRAGRQGSVGGRIVRSFVSALRFQGGEIAADTCNLLDRRLRRRPWTDAEWRS
jgi:hypothetical protein